MAMLMLEFFRWWYGTGWSKTITDLRRRLDKTTQMFSLSIILRTLFAPWRRIITPPGQSLDTRFRSFIDNMVSRLVGLVVRLVTLVVALICMSGVALISLLVIIVWPLLPAVVIVALVKGIIG